MALPADQLDADLAGEIGSFTIYWSGQALGYNTGQLALRRPREKAEVALGPRFDLRGLHDAVLHGGAVTLPALDARIEAWLTSRKAPSPG